MDRSEHYDDLVLGSGEGGKYLAWHLARSGRRVAVIERRWIGGSCPNINCLPSKNEIWSAQVAHLARHAPHYGTSTGAVTTDMLQVRQRKREMVEGLIAMHLDLYSDSGAELILGEGRLVAPRTIEVRSSDGASCVLDADRVFLNLGTHPTVPDIPGLAEAGPLTNIELFELGHAPDHLVVIGGGYVGLECAQAFRRFGSRVTIVQRGPQVAGREDADVAKQVAEILRSDEIEVLLSTETLRVEGRSGEQVTLTVETSSGERRIEASDILVATGRRPNTAGIGLEQAGIELDERGYVVVNERLETSAVGVWAIGECAGTPQFTHVSLDDFRIIRDNLEKGPLEGGGRTARGRLVPYCMFIDPPLARVGLSEGEAKRRGVAVRTATLPMSAVLRTRTTGRNMGFMKTVVSAEDDRILGFTMIGQDAGEVMAAVQMAIMAELPYTRLRDAILAHPTTAEGLNALYAKVPARA